MDPSIKKENLDYPISNPTPSQIHTPNFTATTSTTSSSSFSDPEIGDGSSSVGDGNKRKQPGCSFVSSKKTKVFEKLNSSIVPPGFLAPLPRNVPMPPPPPCYQAGEEEVESPMPLSVYYDNQENNDKSVVLAAPPPVARGCRQFWRAGDYEEVTAPDTTRSSVGMDHVRVHPRFLHSNATSHKWALGAFAELLDNALDEASNGATYVHVDVLKNQRDNSFMLLVEDNGGGMSPNKMRHCMSLGYSAKSKMANTIGQYGNGFKTSSMRLGADVIVFSRCNGDNGTSATLSVGLLSYTFLTATGQEDIVVPMVNFEKKGDDEWAKAGRTIEDWDATFNIILQWSPFTSSRDILSQFDSLENQGTKIIIYNLWEDDESNLELDFDSDPHDIQIRGVNRDEKMIKMARQYPSSRHFLTYKHSLRSYASILYMKLPTGFRILLRGKEIEHHNVVNDMKMVQDITYKPMNIAEGNGKNNRNMVATGKIGFVKDADHHIDVQGFNVYHKNRLIKPFWRVWNAAGSDGRGVIGVLEANFIEPAHDKQGFERTTSLSRLEARLVAIQKGFWSSNCQEIGYAARRSMKNRNASSSGCSNRKGESSANGIKSSPVDGTTSSEQPSTQGIRNFPSVKPVILTPRGPSSEQNSSSINRPNLASPEPLLNSSGSARTPQMAPHLRQAGIRINGLNTGNIESINSSKQTSSESTERRLHDMVDILMKSLQRERDIKHKLESQLSEKTKELETEKTKSEKLQKDNLALLDLLQNERNIWAKKEKDLNKELQNVLQTTEGSQQEQMQQKDRTMKGFKIEPHD